MARKVNILAHKKPSIEDFNLTIGNMHQHLNFIEKCKNKHNEINAELANDYISTLAYPELTTFADLMSVYFQALMIYTNKNPKKNVKERAAVQSQANYNLVSDNKRYQALLDFWQHTELGVKRISLRSSLWFSILAWYGETEFDSHIAERNVLRNMRYAFKFNQAIYYVSHSKNDICDSDFDKDVLGGNGDCCHLDSFLNFCGYQPIFDPFKKTMTEAEAIKVRLKFLKSNQVNLVF